MITASVCPVRRSSDDLGSVDEKPVSRDGAVDNGLTPAIISFRPSLVPVPVGHNPPTLGHQQDPSLSFWCHLQPPPLSSASSPLAPLLATAGRTAPGCLCGRQPQCTLYCAVCVHCTALLLLQSRYPGHGGDLQLAGFIHLYRLALCLKQGFW